MSFAGILDRLIADASGRTRIFLEPGHHGPAQRFDARDLVALALRAGARFRADGANAGDRIVTILPTGRPLLQTILGAWAIGAVIAVLAPGVETGRSSLSLDRLGRMLGRITPRVVVTDAETRARIAPLVAGFACHVLVAEDLPVEGEGAIERHANRAEDMAFVQFTSGSTGDPKAIAIEHGQLIVNVEETATHLDFDSRSTLAFWLPLHHDLGFVTCLMMPLATGAEVVLLPTESFIANPVNWLNAIDRFRATHSCAPPFGCQIVSRRSILKRAANVDLTSLRYLALGAEPVPWQTIQEFEEAYAGHGLRPGATRAAFGMAEATLAVASGRPFGTRRLVWIDRDLYRTAGQVRLVPPRAPEGLPLLSNGPAIGSMSLRIADADGLDLGEGRLGRLLISGPSVTKRYFGSEEPTTVDGWLDTGDLGFLLHGELFIAGRAKDVIIRGGVNVNAHEVEDAVLLALPDEAQRAVAFALPRLDDPRDEIVVGVEIRQLPPREGFAMDVAEAILRHAGLQIDHVIPLPRGSIPRTTSGKIQRSRARDLYREGALAAPRPS